MNPHSDSRFVDGKHALTGSCKDSFRYRLVKDNGRHRMLSVRFVGSKGCASDDLAELISMLEGKWLDQIDAGALGSIKCPEGRCGGCPQEVAREIRDLQDTFLPERHLQIADARERGKHQAAGRSRPRSSESSRRGFPGRTSGSDEKTRQVVS